MNRRDAIGGLIALGAASMAARAQTDRKVWRVGFLVPRERPASLDADFLGAFPKGMRELGYIEGKNLIIEWRFTDGSPNQLAVRAAELARLNVDAIVTGGNGATATMQKAATTIPIVMAGNVDPVGSGLIRSLAQPGGNTTGPSNLSAELGPKRLELLLAMAPRASRIAVLVNPGNVSSDRSLESTAAAGQQRRLTILPAKARAPNEIDAAFAAMARDKAAGLIVMITPLFIRQRHQVAELAAKYRLPAITPDPIFVEAGCMMSYGDSLNGNYRRTAYYVDRILKGAKPADLPVEEPTSIELFINRKTASSLGLTIPRELLLQANKVIE